LYNLEVKKPVAQRWMSPNSTDIKPLKSPQFIAAYISKYITKDILDNPDLTHYQNEVSDLKKCIYSTMKDIQQYIADNKDVTQLNETLENQKNLLNSMRKSCPIQGKMWFKSATLTPFLTGAKDYIYSELSFELKELLQYLESKNTESRKYVVKLYEQDEHGNNLLNKIICISLFISVFEVEKLKDDHGKKKFPLLVKMWKDYIDNCIEENKKKKRYEVSEKDLKDFKTII
jgi:hypothetical protein